MGGWVYVHLVATATTDPPPAQSCLGCEGLGWSGSSCEDRVGGGGTHEMHDSFLSFGGSGRGVWGWGGGGVGIQQRVDDFSLSGTTKTIRVRDSLWEAVDGDPLGKALRGEASLRSGHLQLQHRARSHRHTRLEGRGDGQLSGTGVLHARGSPAQCTPGHSGMTRGAPVGSASGTQHIVMKVCAPEAGQSNQSSTPQVCCAGCVILLPGKALALITLPLAGVLLWWDNMRTRL